MIKNVDLTINFNCYKQNQKYDHFSFKRCNQIKQHHKNFSFLMNQISIIKDVQFLLLDYIQFSYKHFIYNFYIDGQSIFHFKILPKQSRI